MAISISVLIHLLFDYLCKAPRAGLDTVDRRYTFIQGAGGGGRVPPAFIIITIIIIIIIIILLLSGGIELIQGNKSFIMRLNIVMKFQVI